MGLRLSAGKNSVKRSLVFFLVPDFTMVAFATALDPLRLANRMLGYDAYKWRLASFDGRPVRASNGVECAVNTSLEDERRKMAGPERPSMVVLCSGINVETYSNKSVFAWLREEYNRGVAIGGLCTGAHVLAAAGLLANKRCAIHWENLPGFQEAFPKANVFADLFEVDQNIYTCAGGTAALDMMLKLIGDDFDDHLVNRVCEQILTDRVRSPSDRQRLPFITLLTDPTMGGVSASFAFIGDIVLAEPNALIGFAGPRVIEQTVREKLPEGFQRAEFLLGKGAIDMIVDRRELRDKLPALLTMLQRIPSVQ